MTTMASVTRAANTGGDPANPAWWDLVTLNFPVANYPTGGYTEIAAQLKAVLGTSKTILDVICAGAGASGYKLEYNRTTDCLMVYYCNYDAGADGPLIEIPDDTALTATGVRLLVLSY